MARLATILSFGDRAEEGAGAFPEPQEDYQQEHDDDDDDDAASDASGDSFEFAFARPLAPAGGEALADDLFAHGRILPAYPVFHRRQAHDDDDASAAVTSATAPPSPDTYCAWAPRSAPGSPAREPAAFPKSASTGTGEAARRFRLRDILGSGGRSHSDGKEKFLFLQPTPAKPKSRTSALSTPSAPAAKKTQAQQKQSKKKGAAAAPTEMDMATAHRLFYSKPGAAAGPGGERTTTKTSYLPYRPAIVGFFATAHALRPKHHPY
ncbi:hypothetical protein CFC21_091528 [Triticum aestivum]|uniref:Uncharacterized protein n=3 Tax=Triticinae TaxID=1648030 RepID=A0A453N6G5_AEGTS|nr:histone-lysine N-methyltransferase 2D [Aegilops tauschii subsp. strangulata]XP_044418501.1 histone-lysine N-methyltransferase 2D-like [Triticum aestivum]KAF7088419.1 hypothetical protein CFC21_091528 [Triticum aestivum]